MMKHNILRIIIAIIVIFLIIISIYFIVFGPEPEFLRIGKDPDKKIEIDRSQLVGWSKGKKIWQIYVDKIWLPRKQNYVFLKEVSSGVLYDKKGKRILNEVSAESGRSRSQADDIELFGHISAFFIGDTKNKTHISAEHLLFDGHKVDIKENIIIEQGSLFISSLRAYLKHPSFNLVTFPESVHIKNNKDSLSSRYFIYDFVNEKGIFSEIVNISTFKPLAKVKANTATMAKDDYYLSGDVSYRSKEVDLQCGAMNKKAGKGFIEATDIIKLAYKDMLIKSDFAKVDEDNQTIVLSDKVSIKRKKDLLLGNNAFIKERKINMENGITIKTFRVGDYLPDKFYKKIKTDKAQKSLKKGAVMTGQKLYFNPKNKCTLITGQAEIVQGQKIAKSEKMYYFEEDGKLILEDNVYLKDDDQWISCKRLFVDLEKEKFVVTGNVRARIFIEK